MRIKMGFKLLKMMKGGIVYQCNVGQRICRIVYSVDEKRQPVMIEGASRIIVV